VSCYCRGGQPGFPVKGGAPSIAKLGCGGLIDDVTGVEKNCVVKGKKVKEKCCIIAT